MYFRGLIMGDPGWGKTTLCVRLGPHAAVTFDRSKYVGTYQRYWGGNGSNVFGAADMDELEGALESAQEYAKANGLNTVVIDDFSLMATAQDIGSRPGEKDQRAVVKKVLEAAVRDIIPFVSHSRYNVIVTTHLRAPMIQADGSITRIGGPLLPGWQLPDRFPSYFNARMRIVASDKFSKTYPRALDTTNNSKWATNVADFPQYREPIPLDLRSIFELMRIPTPKYPDALEEALRTATPSNYKTFALPPMQANVLRSVVLARSYLIETAKKLVESESDDGYGVSP